MGTRLFAWIKLRLHQLSPGNFLECRDIVLRSGPFWWRVPRFIGCDCGRIWYVDKFGDPKASNKVQLMIELMPFVKKGEPIPWLDQLNSR